MKKLFTQNLHQTMINWINSNKRFHHKSITWEKSMFGVTSKLLMAYKCSLFSLLILSSKEHVWSLGCLQNEFFSVHVLLTHQCQNFGNHSHMYTTDIKKLNFPYIFFTFTLEKSWFFGCWTPTNKEEEKWGSGIFVWSKLGHS